MPKAGNIKIEMTPYEAMWISSWLRMHHEPSDCPSLLREFLFQYRDHPDIDALVLKFEKIVTRKRPCGPFSNVEVEIPRGDADWFAKKVRKPGIFFRGPPRPGLPPVVSLLCHRCALALLRGRGRPSFRKQELEQAIQHQIDGLISHKIGDERHLKRLKKKHREMIAMSLAMGREG